MVVQGLSVDVHGLADGLKGLVEAGLVKAAGQPQSATPKSKVMHAAAFACLEPPVGAVNA